MSIPAEYKQLVAIEATGTQYIDTGVNVTSSNYSQLRLIVDELIKSTSGWSVSGCGTAGCIFFVGAYNGTIYYGNGGNYSTGISYPYKRCLFDLNAKSGTYTVDVVASQERIVNVSSISTGSFSKSYPINLFRYSGDNGYHSGIIYGAKIYEDDTLIRDFVPAERLSDGEIGLYDVVNDIFYANAGTRSFGTSVWRISNGYPYIEGLDIPSAFSYTEPYPKWAWRIRNGSYPYLAPLSTTRAFPSENYIKAVRKPTRQTKITGQVTLGDTLMITIDNDIIKSLSKSNSCMNSDLFLPGAANAAEFNLDIRLPTAWTADNFYSTRISLSFWILTDGGWEERPLGSFTPSEVTKSSPGFVKILGYDDMIRLKDIAVSGDIFSEYGHFNTAYGWLKAISEYSGIPLCQSYEELSALPNADIEIMIGSFAEIKTLWDALSEICKHTNCIAFINRYGELELSELKIKALKREISASERMSESFSALTYGTKQLDVTIAHTSGSHGIYVYTAKDESLDVGIVSELPEVVPWRRITGTKVPVSGVFESLKTARFRPFEVDLFGDPALELGDWVNFVGFAAGDEGNLAPITSYRWEWRGMHNISSCGSDTVFGAAKTRIEKMTAAQKEELLNDITNAEAKNLGTYDAMTKYTYDELKRFTYDQLGGNG